MPNQPFNSDIAFTSQVKQEQEKRGSRSTYENMMQQKDWDTTVTHDLAAYIANANSFYFATANANGQPYIQHRGGPKGFLKVIDSQTLGFADYAGNRQYISIGNLNENNKAYLFIMDYANRQRVKIWGQAHLVEDDEDLIKNLMPAEYRARPERVILFKMTAWDGNCPQHIPQKIDLVDVQTALQAFKQRISELEEENAELKSFLKTQDK